MLTTSLTTAHRKRKRFYARVPVALTGDRRSIRLVVPPTPGMPDAIDAPDAPWPVSDSHADLDRATWEDAEWR